MARFRPSISAGRSPRNPSLRGFAADARRQFKEIERNFAAFIGSLKNAAPEIMVDALQPTFELSQTYVPVATGALKASGYLEIDQASKTPLVHMGYGHGGTPSYAALVHESLEIPHVAPTRAKFLSSAIDEDLPNIKTRLVEGFSSVVKS